LRRKHAGRSFNRSLFELTAVSHAKACNWKNLRADNRGINTKDRRKRGREVGYKRKQVKSPG
jgi:hypothetical protein